MNIALLLKSELRRSAGILAGMALIIALALSIAVAAGICERMVKASAAQSADDFDLLIGARGSSSALLLGTVFLRDEMLPIVPASAWANIREAQTAKSSIRWAAPVAFGDRTPSGRTIVGTTRSFLDRGKSREPAAGRFFTKPTEAVAGASSGYVIGDKFSPMHGRVHGALLQAPAWHCHANGQCRFAEGFCDGMDGGGLAACAPYGLVLCRRGQL